MKSNAAPHPGPTASSDEMLRLAETYHRSALRLLEEARGKEPIARAPGRFCALHAIELYLDAFLRSLGESPCRLRAHGHDLRMRAALAMDRGLALRTKTRLHLIRLTVDREYLALRYGPDRAASVSDLNRLTATLAEIGRKVREAASAPARAEGPGIAA